MVDTIHVQRNMIINQANGDKDFYMAEVNGRMVMKGTFTRKEAILKLQKEDAMEEAMVLASWLPTIAHPASLHPLAILFAKPDLLKRYAVQLMKWVTKPQGLKMGEVSYDATVHYKTLH